MTNGGVVKVLVVDDDPFVRSALSTLINAADGLSFAGEADDGAEVEQAVREHQPDVVLMDLQMAQVDGVTATKRLCGLPGAPVVVVLTNHLDDVHVGAALRAGASGYLLKNSPPGEITAAILAAVQGETVLSPDVTRRLVAAFTKDDGRPQAPRDWARGLTAREREVAEAVGAGLANQQIADQLYMSLSTVKSNVSRILAKLLLSNRVQLALLVHGLLDPQDAPAPD